MRGLMMDFPLTLAPLLERAGKLFDKIEIVSRRPDRSCHRYTYAEFYRRARALGEALIRAGLKHGDRVATLMWNHAPHLEAYWGIPVAGGVIHTLNARLHPDEIAYIINQAGDRFLILDDVLLPVYESLQAKVKLERVIVVPSSGKATPPGVEDYEAWLAQARGEFTYPALDENEAAAMCFTSGTTGKPKGVLYSHRALVLHSLAQGLGDTFGLAHGDVLLPVAPMFHANAWGLPYTAVMLGIKMVFPGQYADAESLLELIEREQVTVACGVPTIWISVLAALENGGGRWKLCHAVRLPVGGAAPPEALIRALDRHGLHIIHCWGMTETAPVATTGHLKSYMEGWPEERKYEVRAKQGRAAPLVELRVMRPEGLGQEEAPWDGSTVGELEVRGPWVASSYYNAPEEQHRWTADGWFRTGDVASIDPEGYVKIVDRTKDLIKSGGEWISSADLENALMGHPAVVEAAVIAVPHPKWQERPLAVVVFKDGASATPEELRAFLAAKFAKWQLPDAFVAVKEIPRTSVGKFLKMKLREQFANWRWES
ncbi:MAG TPA: long-chain fatty acid--CoA ligase [Candidatus Acidoferrales bacterium]|nr:long-chain fatty acid--CoA ligase [Candidatus Acidoferrales bacterium]